MVTIDISASLAMEEHINERFAEFAQAAKPDRGV